jgi:hypothetical protein
LAGTALLPAVAKAFVGGVANVAGTMPVQPAAAATWGFNTPIFWDDFNSLSTIDVNNTLTPGYKWYMRYVQGTNVNGGNPIVSPPSSVSVANSILTYTPPSSGGWLTTMGCAGSLGSISLVGDNMAPQGAYFECSMQYNVSQAQNPWWPAFLLFDNNLTLAQPNNLTFPSNGYGEIDFMEANWSSGAPQLGMRNYTWYSSYANGDHQFRNNNITPNVGTNYGNDGNFHRYGALWVPQSKNGGTGLIQRYVDGVHQTDCDVTYSSTTAPSSCTPSSCATGWMSCLDTNTAGFGLQIGSGNAWPIQVEYVMVWA